MNKPFSLLTDKWEVLPENVDTGLCEIQTVTRGTDVPTLGYFVAYAYDGVAQHIAELHNKQLEA